MTRHWIRCLTVNPPPEYLLVTVGPAASGTPTDVERGVLPQFWSPAKAWLEIED